MRGSSVFICCATDESFGANIDGEEPPVADRRNVGHFAPPNKKRAVILEKKMTFEQLKANLAELPPLDKHPFESDLMKKSKKADADVRKSRADWSTRVFRRRFGFCKILRRGFEMLNLNTSTCSSFLHCYFTDLSL